MPKFIFTYLPFHLIYLSIKFYFLLIFCKHLNFPSPTLEINNFIF